MTTEALKRRMPIWRALLWAGVIGSVLAWTWAWYLGRGPAMMMLVFALAAVALAFRAADGMRWALAGVMIAGFAMFLASLYWFALILVAANGPVTVTDVFAASVLPMVAAMVLLAGAAVGFRHAKAESQPEQAR